MITSIRRAATAVGFCFVLTACGGGIEDVPGVTPDGVSIDSSKDGDISFESDDGSLTGGMGKLPEGFPIDDIPLVEGTVLTGAAINIDDEQGFTVVLTDVKDDHDAAVALLKAKGFTVDGSFEAAGGQTSTLTSSDWGVLVSSSEASGASTISYTVSASDIG